MLFRFFFFLGSGLERTSFVIDSLVCMSRADFWGTLFSFFRREGRRRKKLHTPHDFFVQSEEEKFFFGMRKHHFLTLKVSCTSEYHVHLVETSRKWFSAEQARVSDRISLRHAERAHFRRRSSPRCRARSRAPWEPTEVSCMMLTMTMTRWKVVSTFSMNHFAEYPTKNLFHCCSFDSWNHHSLLMSKWIMKFFTRTHSRED